MLGGIVMVSVLTIASSENQNRTAIEASKTWKCDFIVVGEEMKTTGELNFTFFYAYLHWWKYKTIIELHVSYKTVHQ